MASPDETSVKECACGCGGVIPAFDSRGKPRKWFDRTRCPTRAQRKHKEPPEIVACDCGCGKTFPNRTQYGRPRRWFSPKCCYKSSVALSPEAQQNKRDREHARRTKVAGRICIYCDKTDADGKWGSGSTEYCENCRRQMAKKKCELCGGPFYVYKCKDRPAGCVARCEEYLG